MNIVDKTTIKHRPKCLYCNGIMNSCGPLKTSNKPGNPPKYKYKCKSCNSVYRVECFLNGSYNVLPKVRNVTNFKYEKLYKVPEKKVKRMLLCLKYPFGRIKKDDPYYFSEKISKTIFKDTRNQTRLFNIAALRRKWIRKDVIRFLKLLICKINKKHCYWKYAKSPRIWYNVYSSEKRFINTLSKKEKKKLIKILTTIKKKDWINFKRELKLGVSTYKETHYRRFYNYRSINAFFGSKDIPNFQTLINDPSPQNVNRVKKIKPMIPSLTKQ